ncbi:invasion associated locus B family protein [Tabrizicola sp. TH137]|uniref:invasion associated locus B family protein n=1 Tax=Tabrizicola sp. TH137 TaxID=2067452 RepID=UPI000C7AC0C3|nr:invasion associated locus B family protein [Tabrizicola sp. TH137]
MSLLSLPRSASLALALGLTAVGGSMALAQESTEAPAEGAAAEAPADGLSMGQAPAEGPGSSYVKEAFNDWELRCVRVESGTEPCQLYQLLQDGQGTSVAEIGLFSLPEGGEAAAGATIIVPLETLLTAGLRLGVDDAQPKIYPFTFCSQAGCVARVGFTAEEVDAFRKGGKAVMTIVPAVAPDQSVALDISLAGFTAGFEAVAATRAAEPEAQE